VDEDILPVNFADVRRQNQWMERAHYEKYKIPLLQNRFSSAGFDPESIDL
jgi:hypothetical protein